MGNHELLIARTQTYIEQQWNSFVKHRIEDRLYFNNCTFHACHIEYLYIQLRSLQDHEKSQKIKTLGFIGCRLTADALPKAILLLNLVNRQNELKELMIHASGDWLEASLIQRAQSWPATRHPENNVQTIRLFNCTFESQAFLDGVREHKRGIRNLTLQACRLNNQCFSLLVGVLTSSQTPTKHTLQVLDISGNGKLGSGCFSKLSKLLRKIPALRELHIASCSSMFYVPQRNVAQDHPFFCFLTTLEANTTLTCLNLSNNNIRQTEFVDRIFQIFTTNSSLQTLSVAGCCNPGPSLISKLTHMKALRTLNVSKYLFLKTVEFQDALAKNTVLSSLGNAAPLRNSVIHLLDRNDKLCKMEKLLGQTKRQDSSTLTLTDKLWPHCAAILMGTNMSAVYGFLLAMPDVILPTAGSKCQRGGRKRKRTNDSI